MTAYSGFDYGNWRETLKSSFKLLSENGLKTDNFMKTLKIEGRRITAFDQKEFNKHVPDGDWESWNNLLEKQILL